MRIMRRERISSTSFSKYQCNKIQSIVFYLRLRLVFRRMDEFIKRGAEMAGDWCVCARARVCVCACGELNSGEKTQSVKIKVCETGHKT